MALPSTGSLSIKTAAGSDRSIAQEVDGNTTGNKSLTTLSTSAGKTAPHSMLEFRGYATSPPLAPTSVDATYDSDIAMVIVSWTPNTFGSDATLFRIERYGLSNPVWTLATTTDGNDTSIFDDPVSDQYLYRVRAENSGGASSYTESNSVIVP